ncbi:hypothetical protein JCM33374_g1003 [Metschnikowia sp. JCM 33374]|nr:hypothetical protein JCM33374_g1003 [Metschnikowia sp. JCM 33374]
MDTSSPASEGDNPQRPVAGSGAGSGQNSLGSSASGTIMAHSTPTPTPGTPLSSAAPTNSTAKTSAPQEQTGVSAAAKTGGISPQFGHSNDSPLSGQGKAPINTQTAGTAEPPAKEHGAGVASDAHSAAPQNAPETLSPSQTLIPIQNWHSPTNPLTPLKTSHRPRKPPRSFRRNKSPRRNQIPCSQRSWPHASWAIWTSSSTLSPSAKITVVKFLVENPYSAADPNRLGGTLAASPLHWACRNGLVYVVDYFLSHTSADPALTDSQQYNALHLAVHSSNITLVVYILLKCVSIDKSIYIDEPENIQCTALHWAAYQGDILTVKALLHYGADVSKVDKSLMTPLHWAFIRGYKSVLATLVDAGSDLFHKNDKGRDSFGVAEDMNCQNTWHQVLKEADRNPKNNWALNNHLLNERAAKLITFITPYVTLPIMLNICDFGSGYVIPKLFFSVVIFASSVLFLQKFIIPVYLRKDGALFQTPFLAGLFSATANWAILTWAYVVLPVVWSKKFFTSVALAIVIVAFTYSFFKAMIINPGNVPVPTDSQVVFDDVKELVSLGKFDTEHFCVNTFIRKPLRSKFSKASNSLVARFDHYCPWVYNDIGVRNHKLFMTFVYSLMVAIVLFSSSVVEYFDMYAERISYASDDEDQCWLLSEEVCIGFKHKHFTFNLMFWCWVQGIWIMFLCIVQTFQICKGLTTWEFSTLDKRMSNQTYNHSTLPGDFQIPNSNSSQSAHPTSHGHRRKNGLGTCMKLLGLDQFSMTLKVGSLSLLKNTTHNQAYSSIESFDIPTDFGWKQNWLDFWFIGDIEWRNLFFLPIYGENNLNGKVVDYYKLYEYPAKASGADAV